MEEDFLMSRYRHHLPPTAIACYRSHRLPIVPAGPRKGGRTEGAWTAWDQTASEGANKDAFLCAIGWKYVVVGQPHNLLCVKVSKYFVPRSRTGRVLLAPKIAAWNCLKIFRSTHHPLELVTLVILSRSAHRPRSVGYLTEYIYCQSFSGSFLFYARFTKIIQLSHSSPRPFVLLLVGIIQISPQLYNAQIKTSCQGR